MKTIFTIAKNTFRETIRDRILLSAGLIIAAIVLFSLFVASISLDQSTRIILDFGVTAIYALQMFIAIFIGSMLMYKEIERKTFYLLLPKPVSRTEIIIGKCLGLTATTVTVTTIATAFLCALLFAKSGQAFVVPIVISLILSTIEAVILILISILFSSFTSPIIAAAGALTFYFVGHAGDILRYLFMTTKSTIVEVTTAAMYYLLPNLEKFNLRNEVVYGITSNPRSIIFACIYAVFYALILLVITQIIFKKRDF